MASSQTGKVFRRFPSSLSMLRDLRLAKVSAAIARMAIGNNPAGDLELIN